MVKVRTLNFHKWELKEIEEIMRGGNRSWFVSEALRAQLREDRENGLLNLESGLKIITVSMDDKLHNAIEKLNQKGVFVSFSEFARRAVRNKIIRERERLRVASINKALPNDVVYIPSMNGGIPFRTRRLD